MLQVDVTPGIQPPAMSSFGVPQGVPLDPQEKSAGIPLDQNALQWAYHQGFGTSQKSARDRMELCAKRAALKSRTFWSGHNMKMEFTQKLREHANF